LPAKRSVHGDGEHLPGEVVADVERAAGDHHAVVGAENVTRQVKRKMTLFISACGRVPDKTAGSSPALGVAVCPSGEDRNRRAFSGKRIRQIQETSFAFHHVVVWYRKPK
jgi:hypothetical protein